MKNKTSDADAEVSEATTKSKKHVTLEEKPSSRSNSPKIKASSATGTDIRNRYLMIFPLFIHRRQTHAHTQEWKSFLKRELCKTQDTRKNKHTWSLKIEVKSHLIFFSLSSPQNLTKKNQLKNIYLDRQFPFHIDQCQLDRRKSIDTRQCVT